MIKATACDEDGHAIMDEAKVDALRDADPNLFQLIADAALQAAGLGSTIEQRVKNSDKTQNVDSRTA